MSTVRITDTLRDRVRSKVKEMYAHMEYRIRTELGHLKLADEAYEHLISRECEELAERLNSSSNGKWVNTIDEVYVTVSAGTGTDGRAIDMNFKSKLSRPRCVPLKRSHYAPTLEGNKNTEAYKLAQKAVVEIHDLQKQMEVVIEQLVEEAMTKTKTVKQLLEVWPTAISFLPEDVVKKHNERVVYKTGQKQEPVNISEEAKINLVKLRLMSSGD